MDLAKLASEIGNTTNNNSKAINQLMPQQQKTRSYQDEKPSNYSELVITAERFKMGETRLGWVLQYKLHFPIGTTNQQKADPKQFRDFAKDYLASNTDQQDLKYIDITRADSYMVEYRFNHKKWFQENFSKRPNYKPPIKLRWKYQKAFPRIIYVNNYGSDLKHYIEKEFEKWIDRKRSYLKHSKLKFVEKIAAKLFDFKWDYTDQSMNATLKYSVIIGSLALYMDLYHGKNPEKYDMKRLKRSAESLKDIDKLDRYLKRFK